MLEVLLLPVSKELDGFGAKGDGDFLTGLLQRFWVEEAFDLVIVEWTGQLPRGQH